MFSSEGTLGIVPESSDFNNHSGPFQLAGAVIQVVILIKGNDLLPMHFLQALERLLGGKINASKIFSYSKAFKTRHSKGTRGHRIRRLPLCEGMFQS